MVKNVKILILNLPSPPNMDVNRDYSGGYGTAHKVKRDYYGHSGNLVFPLFLPYVATTLKKAGYALSVLDGQAMKYTKNQVLSSIEKENPEVIISMISLPSIYGDIDLLKKVKEATGAFLIGIGAVCKVMPEEILLKSNIDVVIRDNYPTYGQTLLNLVENFERFKGDEDLDEIKGISYLRSSEVVNNSSANPVENLDDIDFSVYTLLPMDRYKLYFNDLSGKDWNYFPILSSKGCPFPCIYCPYPIGFGKKIIYKSVGKLIQEIEFLKDNFGFNAFLFRDQVFTMDQKRVEKICDEIIQRGLDIKWLFETRVDKISGNLLRKISKAGCNRIHYGVETGDPELLKIIGKPGVSREIVKKTIKTTKENNILTMVHIIVGLPGETKKSLENTYNFILDLDPDYASWNLITPYPGTKLFEMAKEKKLILTYDWSMYTADDLVMRTESLSGEELLKAKEEMDRNFKIRKNLKILGRSFYDKRSLEFLVRRVLFHIFPK